MQLPDSIRKLVLFLAVGLPAFLAAFPLNFLLVDRCGMPKTLAYAFVLVVQVNINFPLCRKFVFEPAPEKSVWRQYGEFMGAVAAFRGLDWVFYSFCVEALRFPLVVAGRDCYYLAYQLANVVVFSLAKFVFCRRAIEGNKK
ncbi:MAG: GtrA family protein [Kiritimatiellae bacterium]|nr:GtrA family protein [Kiritimatiellia bacterium]